jgi:N-acetylglucosaminyl-diphospho-decaprenol L-rhamnosyltransferase
MSTGSVVIVTYNSAEQIGTCLAALHNESAWQRIVVDNASQDDSVTEARKTDPGALVVSNHENVGFAAAANQGARLGSGSIILFLNPDAVAQPGALEALTNALNQHSVGAVGGALLHMSGEIDRGFSVRRFPTTLSTAAEILLLNRLWPNNAVNRRYRCLDLDYSSVQEVEQPAGACLAVRREVWESIGGFDERFFPVWFEDVDFCRRVRVQNWKILYSPAARFLHSGGHSVSQIAIGDRQIFWYRNLLRYWRKHENRAAVGTLRLTIALGMVLRSLAALLGSNPEKGRSLEAIRAYANVINECAFKGPAPVRSHGH